MSFCLACLGDPLKRREPLQRWFGLQVKMPSLMCSWNLDSFGQQKLRAIFLSLIKHKLVTKSSWKGCDWINSLNYVYFKLSKTINIYSISFKVNGFFPLKNNPKKSPGRIQACSSKTALLEKLGAIGPSTRTPRCAPWAQRRKSSPEPEVRSVITSGILRALPPRRAKRRWGGARNKSRKNQRIFSCRWRCCFIFQVGTWLEKKNV